MSGERHLELARAVRSVVLILFGCIGVTATVEYLNWWPALVVPGSLLIIVCEVWHAGSKS